MADTVQYLQEQMIPELEDLERRGLFTRDEIKQIVRQRSNFEYRLKRRSPLRGDFVAYIEYETKLESLRALRKRAMVRALRAANMQWRPSLSDRAIRRRIMFIYDRAVRKFKADLSLWLAYLEFCRSSGGTRQLQKVLTRVLQLHSTAPGLWMYAAAWEFEQNLNVMAARALMQRGLRMCPKSESLWLEYARMELTYAQKLRARRLVLGIPAGHGAPPSSSGAARDSQAETPGAGTQDDGPASRGGGADVLEGGGEGPPAEDSLSEKVVLAIYRRAIAALPRSLGFRERFLGMLREVEFAGAADVEGAVYDSLAQDFPREPRCWALRAARPLAERRRGRGLGRLLSLREAHETSFQVFEEGLKAAPCQELYELYAATLVDSFDALSDGGEGPGLPARDIESARAALAGTIAAKVRSVVVRARGEGAMSEALGGRHLAFLLRCGDMGGALRSASELSGPELQGEGGGVVAATRLLLECCSSAGLRLGAPGGPEVGRQAGELVAYVSRALEHASAASQLAPLALLALEQAREEGGPAEQSLRGALEAALARCEDKDEAGQLGCLLVGSLLHSKGIAACRSAYDRLLRLPGPSRTFLLFCAGVEADAAAAGDDDALPRMRKIFEIAVERLGDKDTDLWLAYCHEELQAGNFEAANILYSRARKTLRDDMLFMQHYPCLT